MDKQTIIKQLKKVKPAFSERYGITELALFGSYSRNEETDKSDIDILVSYKNPLGLNFFDMVYELEDLFKNKTIQVVSRGAIKPKYFDRIKEDLVYA